jgi:hypothetical protein
MTKPAFILHVGLPKTGTTFLQCTLTAHANVTVPVLMMNNYEFMGVGPYTSERNNPCHQTEYDEQFLRMSKNAVFDQANDWNINVDFRQRVRELHERGNHGILVFEYAFRYTDEHLGKLADLLNPWFNVEVVVAYRPFFMWLPSMYNQVAKAGLTSSYWPDQKRDDRKNRMIKSPAPDALGFDLEDRPAFEKSYLTVFEGSRQHPSAVTKANYQKYFPQVHLFPTELGTRIQKRVDPMLEHFFCCIVPNAPNACQAIRTGLWDFDSSGSNPSESLDEDILAVAAYKAKYVPPGVTRTVVRRVIADRVKELRRRQRDKKAAPFPLQCWSSGKLKRLEQLSLDMEQSLFDGDNQWTRDLRRLDESVHHQLFLQAVAKQKFCSVDVKRTLKDWRDFFQSKEYIEQLLSYTVREANGEDLVMTS